TSGTDLYRCEFLFIQVSRQHGLAADRDFANAVASGIHYAHFHPWQRFANSIRAKRLQIVDRDRRARFRKSVAVGHGDPEIVEKLKSLRFGERAAHNDGTEFPAKCLMNLFEEATADAGPWPAFCHGLVDRNKSI